MDLACPQGTGVAGRTVLGVIRQAGCKEEAMLRSGAGQGGFPEGGVIGAGQGWRGPPLMVGGRPFLPGHGLSLPLIQGLFN